MELIGYVCVARAYYSTRVGAIPNVRILRYKWLRSKPNACAAFVIFHRFSSNFRKTNSRSYAERASCKLSYGFCGLFDAPRKISGGK